MGPVHYDFNVLLVEVDAVEGQPYFLLDPQLVMATTVIKIAVARKIFFMFG